MTRIELSEAELIVLNDVLDTLGDREDLDHLIPDAADRQAIHNLVCLLERANPAILDADYATRLHAARRELLPGDR